MGQPSLRTKQVLYYRKATRADKNCGLCGQRRDFKEGEELRCASFGVEKPVVYRIKEDHVCNGFVREEEERKAA